MDRAEALAICFANLKGSKHKDLLLTARALKYLKLLPEYGSNSKVGNAVDVSGEMVRQFISLLDLPSEITEMIDRRELNLEQSRRLWQLTNHRPSALIEAAYAIKTLNAMDARHVIKYLIRHPELNVQQARDELLDSRTVVQKEFHVISLLSGEEYRALANAAQKRGVSPNALATDVVKTWLETEDRNGI